MKFVEWDNERDEILRDFLKKKDEEEYKRLEQSLNMLAGSFPDWGIAHVEIRETKAMRLMIIQYIDNSEVAINITANSIAVSLAEFSRLITGTRPTGMLSESEKWIRESE